MSQPNALSTLLVCGARAYDKHNSQIATVASEALIAASEMPVVKQAQRVDQCSALKPAYAQHSSLLNKEIEQLESELHWADTGASTKTVAVQSQLAYTELLGPTGMTINNSCRVGLLLQTAQSVYPNHKHEAEELYLVISGTALWSKSNGDEKPYSPGSFIHHASWEPHAMKTTTEPLLTMWCWTGGIGYDTYEML